MSIDRTDTVDAVAVRDGWAVLSIHQFGEWSEIDDAEEATRRKIRTYFQYVQGPRYQEKLHRLPARIELVSVHPVPPTVKVLCELFGIDVQEGE